MQAERNEIQNLNTGITKPMMLNRKRAAALSVKTILDKAKEQDTDVIRNALYASRAKVEDRLDDARTEFKKKKRLGQLKNVTREKYIEEAMGSSLSVVKIKQQEKTLRQQTKVILASNVKCSKTFVNTYQGSTLLSSDNELFVKAAYINASQKANIITVSISDDIETSKVKISKDLNSKVKSISIANEDLVSKIEITQSESIVEFEISEEVSKVYASSISCYIADPNLYMTTQMYADLPRGRLNVDTITYVLKFKHNNRTFLYIQTQPDKVIISDYDQIKFIRDESGSVPVSVLEFQQVLDLAKIAKKKTSWAILKEKQKNLEKGSYQIDTNPENAAKLGKIKETNLTEKDKQQTVRAHIKHNASSLLQGDLYLYGAPIKKLISVYKLKVPFKSLTKQKGRLSTFETDIINIDNFLYTDLIYAVTAVENEQLDEAKMNNLLELKNDTAWVHLVVRLLKKSAKLVIIIQDFLETNKFSKLKKMIASCMEFNNLFGEEIDESQITAVQTRVEKFLASVGSSGGEIARIDLKKLRRLIKPILALENVDEMPNDFNINIWQEEFEKYLKTVLTSLKNSYLSNAFTEAKQENYNPALTTIANLYTVSRARATFTNLNQKLKEMLEKRNDLRAVRANQDNRLDIITREIAAANGLDEEKKKDIYSRFAAISKELEETKKKEAELDNGISKLTNSLQQNNVVAF